MSGDWIKMRGELWTHPKFIALSNALIYTEGLCEGMLAHACGEDVLAIGVMPPSNESVTTRALRMVTKRALRDVTMCALLRVWIAVNAHCKVVGDDAVCAPMGLGDLDEIAGFPGFGEALNTVGWVDQGSDDDSLIFKNFCEYNEPAILRRKPAKTGAERQAEFRARKRVTKGVTKSNESNAREEKRRSNTPISPKGDSSVTLSTFIEACRERNEKIVSDYKPLLAYTANVKLPAEFLQLAWQEFKRRFGNGGAAERKQYKDWRRTFRNYVENNYLKLWLLDAASGEYRLTTVGLQAQRAVKGGEA